MSSQRDVLFAHLFRVADSIAASFGRNCEAVVHDFNDRDHSVVHLAGDVTHRQVGAPITDFVLTLLRRDGDLARDMTGYQTLTRDGRVLKSSTTFVRDGSGHIIGALCINFDVTTFRMSIGAVQDLIALTDRPGARAGRDGRGVSSETFATSVEETVDAVIARATEYLAKPVAHLNLDERVRFVAALDEQGIFMIRGSVQYIATVLGVSKYTIYNYLQRSRANDRLNVM